MYTVKLNVQLTLSGSPDEDAARLALAERLRALADDLEHNARPAPSGAADGCAACWYVDQLAATAPSRPAAAPPRQETR